GRATRNEEPGTGASETLASTENSNVVRNDHAGRMKPSPSGDPAPRVGNTTLTAKKTTTEDALGPEQTSPNVRDLPVNADPDNGANDEGGAELAIRPSVTEGCPGTTVEFSAEHLPDEGIFLWNFGDGSFSNKPNPSHAYSKSGRFEVMLSHSSMAGGNIRNKPSSDLIVIHEAPEADFVPQPQQFNGHLPSTHFENRSLGGKQYHWDFGDGVTSNVPHPDHVYRKQGTYHVELVVTNARGCVDRQEKKVVVEHDYNLLAPEAFSPNGDGTNDLFIPEALRDLHLRFKLSIHDAASGELVYETTDATKPWTGRRSNRGDLCTAGTYVWVVEFPDAAHLSDIPFQGEVTLVR
ncbi:MAG: PKD domain-containing protein, partial [Flavobacteriales bacterium]|nr:PKD domain-containing protein [Flavobacteriales bacterium]